MPLGLEERDKCVLAKNESTSALESLFAHPMLCFSAFNTLLFVFQKESRRPKEKKQ
jgi:hypothetical protein